MPNPELPELNTEKTEVDREQFMVLAYHAAEACLTQMTNHLEQYRAWSKQLWKIKNLLAKIDLLERNKYHLTFFEDGAGTLIYESEKKEDIGFSKYSKGGE